MNHITAAQSRGEPLFPGDIGAGMGRQRLSPEQEFQENLDWIVANGIRNVNTIINEGIAALKKSS